jgi:hypothetical protein
VFKDFLRKRRVWASISSEATSIFDEDLLVQKETFGGELFADPAFQGFLQTDRDGNPRGIIALDPRFTQIRGK